jgi:hypothetical protein
MVTQWDEITLDCGRYVASGISSATITYPSLFFELHHRSPGPALVLTRLRDGGYLRVVA